MRRSKAAACLGPAHSSSSASPDVLNCSSPSSPRSCSSRPDTGCEWLRSRLSARRRMAGGLRVIAGDEGDDLNLIRIEAPQIPILDQIVGVLVMALVTDVDADIVQEG